MSKQLELLEIEKCVASRLWYTALEILSEEINNEYLQSCNWEDIFHFRDLIKNAVQGTIEQQHQEWVTQKLLLWLDRKDSFRYKEKSQLLQFKLSLRLLDCLISDSMRKELEECYIEILQEKTSLTQLKKESFIFLEKQLRKSPSLTSWIINELLRAWPSTCFTFVSMLHDLYFDTLSKITNEENIVENSSSLLCILSKFNLSDAKEDELIAWLFPKLLSSYDSSHVELALYSRKNPKFLKAWHEFLDIAHSRLSSINTLENARNIKCAILTYDTDDKINPRLCSKRLAERVTRTNVHWILDILDICLIYMKYKEYSEVNEILSCPTLKILWPTLLLYFLQKLPHIRISLDSEAWTKSTDLCDSLFFLIEKCQLSVYNDSEIVLKNLNLSLIHQLDVVKWILDNRRNSKSLNTDQNLSIKRILTLMKNVCVLSVLKKSVDIHNSECMNIEQLLKDSEGAVCIFQSYQAMRSMLEVILSKVTCTETTAKCASNYTKVELLVTSIDTLPLRLEVIENIFYMLFLRHDMHFCNIESNSDEEDYETNSEKEKDSSNFESSASDLQKKSGFTCDKYTIREILHCLVNCIHRTKKDLTKLEENNDVDKIQKIICNIEISLNDAFWRLELLTSQDFVNRKTELDVEVDEKVSFSFRMKNKSLFYNEIDASSSENEANSNVEDKSETGSTEAITESKRRKRGRNNTLIKNLNSHFFVNLMLSSKESLVLQCLWKNDYSKAQQVIETFDMTNTPLDGHVLFSKAMQAFRHDIKKQFNSCDTVDTAIKDFNHQILENVRQAAQGGFQTSRIANQLETFVASQGANARLLQTDSSDAKEILTLSVLDLALTMGQSFQSSINFCEVAMKYLKIYKKKDNMRISNFFSNIYKLMYDSNLKMSIPSILCDPMIPLYAHEWKERMSFWKELTEKLRSFRLSQVQSTDVDDEEKIDDVIEGEKCLQEVITVCGNTQSYLQKILVHLQTLRSIVPTDDSNTTMTETVLLNNSVDLYFGYQIFDMSIEPESLEYVAHKLGVNLVHNILVNCCPKLSCDNDKNDTLLNISSDRWGCIILNKSPNDQDFEEKNQDPNQYVSDILSELLQVLQCLCPDSSRIALEELRDLSRNPDVRRVLERTRCLNFLDLGELSVGEHTLAFFLNLWNLMFLHSLLDVWCVDPPTSHLRLAVSLSTINYHVGDLGRTSLATLRSKLLGSMSWDSTFFPQMEDLNEIAWQDLDLIHDPRAIFTMANEFCDTPAIRIYNSQSLDRDLNQAMSDYLENNSAIKSQSTVNSLTSSPNKESVLWLPELVERYENFTGKSATSNESSDSPSKSPKKSSGTVKKFTTPSFSYEIVFRYEQTHDVNDKRQKVVNSIYPTVTWKTRTVKPSLLRYLEGHCWLLSHLVRRIHNKATSILESNGCDNMERTACFENVCGSPWIRVLSKAVFDDNPTLASIQEWAPITDLWVYFEESLNKNRVQNCIDVIDALPGKFLAKNAELQCLRDKLVCRLMSSTMKESCSERILQYVYQIRNVNVLAQTILSSVYEWPVQVCQDALFHAMHHSEKDKLPRHCRLKMKETLCRVTIFRKMIPYCASGDSDEKEPTWYDVVYCTEKADPVRIVESLIESDQFELCIEWFEHQDFSMEIQNLVTQDLLLGLLKNDSQDFKHAQKLLVALPVRQSIKMCKGVLKRLESTQAMRFVIDYLLQRCKSTKVNVYRRAQVGVEILDQLDSKDRRSCSHLLKEPLLLLEQLLMNCKFESLCRILTMLRSTDNVRKADLSIESFDKVVRFYAGKSLDFRVSLQRDNVDVKSKDAVTASTTSGESRSGEFVMPLNVPTREDWVPNEKARECSCCKAVIFSMFNRRHHCRRCGRVVCATCSAHRMRVVGYPNSVMVRVCSDCKEQTIAQMQAAQGTPSAASSEVLESWKLTTDETHNQTVREEFSFEYAPNISLCLTILNLHSDHEAYASFLFDRCDEMKRLLHPMTGGRVNPEIDHALIIKMIRSLLVAAKVKCAKLGLNTGLAHCDRFLSQVDLIATLVQSDCLALIPSDDSLDEHAFRKSRDLLTEKEQWTLALDVSTKSGLETQGVWAAWGKACLKVGYLERARTKFSHCLEKVSPEPIDDWVLLPYPDVELASRGSVDSSEARPERKRQTTKSRPAKDPPLLTEILQILENQSQLNDHQTQPSKPNLAQEILNTLNSLKAVSQGQSVLGQTSWNSKNVYYEESLYYLLTYGSFNSILDFFIRYEEMDKCLAFVVENDIEPDVFFNAIYMKCLNTEIADKLLQAMKTVDTSLMTWKKYLVYTCHSLDKKQFHHTLYYLQLFMKDYIRAAMTCIRFYTNDASNYEDLCTRSSLLVHAQGHLETELNAESLNKRRRRSSCSTHNGTYGSLTMEMEASEIDKHINTIARQLEIAKFLGNAEKEGRSVGQFLKNLVEMDPVVGQIDELPTLFGNQQQKTRLAVLAIVCGRNVEEGFGIAFRIMQDYNLRPQKVYSLAGHVLALSKKVPSIEQLIKCCRSSGALDSQAITDRVLTHCVKILLQNQPLDSTSNDKDRVDLLIRLIDDVELKISAYIESKQLKAAYLLAVKHQRGQDIRKILKEADRLGQNAIRTICTKWLRQTETSP